MVTRADIAPGYQLVQATHSIADFANDHPQLFKDWKDTSNSIITLSIPDEAALLKLHSKLESKGHTSSLFREPDIQDQATSLCLYGTPDIRRSLCHLPLSLKHATDGNV